MSDQHATTAQTKRLYSTSVSTWHIRRRIVNRHDNTRGEKRHPPLFSKRKPNSEVSPRFLVNIPMWVFVYFQNILAPWRWNPHQAEKWDGGWVNCWYRQRQLIKTHKRKTRSNVSLSLHCRKWRGTCNLQEDFSPCAMWAFPSFYHQHFLMLFNSMILISRFFSHFIFAIISFYSCTQHHIRHSHRRRPWGNFTPNRLPCWILSESHELLGQGNGISSWWNQPSDCSRAEVRKRLSK